MSNWSRARRLATWTARWLVILAGLWVLYHFSLRAFGGREKLWLFEKMEEHRFTAMSMLTGSLKLRSGLSKLGHDEQVFNGAVFTNWNYGVPLLQIPFHLAAAKMKSLPEKFFPDRAIYFAYLMAAVPVLWAGLDRLLAMREPMGASKLRRHVLSWAATLFVISTVLYPLMSCRFLIYEETLCYFGVVELLAIAAYVFAIRSSSAWALAGLGAAAGLGLLTRATGLIYLGVWSVLVLLEHRRLRSVLFFALPVVPLLAFWLVSNWVRTGSPVGLGLNNAMPWFDYHTPMQRFGTLCTDTRAHTREVASSLLTAFFVTVKEDATRWPWLSKCHWMYEDRPPPTGGVYDHEPYFGMAVLVALVWMLCHQLRRRESRLAFYVPVALVALLYGTYVWAGAGFVWRYAGDFWPAIVLAAVQYVRFLPPINRPLFGIPLALAFVGCSWATFERKVEPYVSTLEVLDESEAKDMWSQFTNSRYAQDKPIRSHFKCGEHTDWLYHDGQGWNNQCGVDTFSNFFIGVPQRNDTHYQLSFKTEGINSAMLRVYLNGRIYMAYLRGDSYFADVDIHYDRLTSPIVMTTIEWTRALEPVPGVKLLSVQLS